MGIESEIKNIKQALARIETQARQKQAKNTKSKPKLNEKQARLRTSGILKDIGSRTVTVDQLGNIAEKHGMIRSASGALYAGGYLKKGTNGKVSLTQKGRTFKP